MNNLIEQSQWCDGIYQLETSDRALGGKGGVMNRQAQALADRTRYLKDQVEKSSQSLIEHEKSTNHPNATTTQKGFVKLSSAVNSDDEATAATSKAVKLAYERAASNVNSVNGKTGAVTITAADLNVLTRQDLERLFEIYTPSGMPLPWPHAHPPAGWLKCNGAQFDQNRYPLLAKAYPTGVLPDLRGEFIRGLDDGRGVDTERAVNSSQPATALRAALGDFYGSDVDTGNVQIAASIWHAHSDKYNLNIFYDGLTGEGKSLKNNPILADNVITSGQSNSNVPTINSWFTVRPRNIAFLYIVRAA